MPAVSRRNGVGPRAHSYGRIIKIRTVSDRNGVGPVAHRNIIKIVAAGYRVRYRFGHRGAEIVRRNRINILASGRAVDGNRIAARADIKSPAAAGRNDCVIPVACRQCVAAGSDGNLVSAIPQSNRICAVAESNDVNAVAAGYQIIPVSADDRIVPGPGINLIIAVAYRDRIVVPAAVYDIVAFARKNDVWLIACRQNIDLLRIPVIVVNQGRIRNLTDVRNVHVLETERLQALEICISHRRSGNIEFDIERIVSPGRIRIRIVQEGKRAVRDYIIRGQRPRSVTVVRRAHDADVRGNVSDYDVVKRCKITRNRKNELF